MKIGVEVLSRFIEVPREGRALRDLLDDIGIEVKRQEESDLGTLLTLELLANRGDHHCYAGVAREIGGRTGDPVTLPPGRTLEIGASPVPVSIETPLCLVYTVTRLERRSEGALSDADTLPIRCAKQNLVHPAVDATNIANLEIGQPTHAFDAERVHGRIVLRLSRAGERAWPLFTPEPREIPEGLLVVADDEKILAIAGVIGCEDSKTTAETRSILLESACFDPVSVRKASRALGVHTDSSARFERGSDPSAPLAGAGRVAALLESAGWEVVGTTGSFGDWTDPARTIPVDPAAMARFLDVPLDSAGIAERLERYGFTCAPAAGGLAVRVPPHRLWDVDKPADIAEELAKSLGYNATPIGLPPIDRGALPSLAESSLVAVEEVLISHGFFEVFTDGFYGRDLFERLGLPADHPLAAHVETLNSLDRGYSLLKSQCVAQAVETVATNLRMQRRSVKAWEKTRVFRPEAEERDVLWLVANGPQRDPNWASKAPDVDVHWLSGLVAQIADSIGVRLVVGPAEGPVADLLHPGRRASIRHDGRVVGALGEVHPRICQAFKIKRDRPVYLEIDASVLAIPPSPVVFEEPPETPPIERSLAFTLPMTGVAAGDVRFEDTGDFVLRSVDIVDSFLHEEDGRPVRTLTWSLRFEAFPGKTADQLNEVVERMAADVAARWGPRGVKRRI